MNDFGLVQERERLQDLGDESSDQFGRDASKLVVANQLVQIQGKHLKDDAEMLAKYEVIQHAYHIVAVMWIVAVVEHVKDGEFHHGLLEIGGLVLDNFDGDQLMGFDVLTLGNLPKSPLSQQVNNAILFALLITQNVAHVENVVGVLVVETVVLEWMRWTGEDSSGIVR